MLHERDDRPKAEWEVDREFEEKSVVVTVWKLPLRWPKYRVNIGCRGRDGRTFHGFMVGYEGKGRVTLQHDCDEEVIVRLVKEAKGYILGEVQSAEDGRIDRQTRYEESGTKKDRFEQPMGLKKLAKRDAALRKLREGS